MPSFPILHCLWSLLKIMSIESVTLSNHLILFGSFLLLPSIFPSIRVISSESALQIRWSKDWSFSTSPSNEYSGLISFRTDWFDLLPETLKSLFQHQSSKTSVLWCMYFLELYSREGLPFFPSMKSLPGDMSAWSLVLGDALPLAQLVVSTGWLYFTLGFHKIKHSSLGKIPPVPEAHVKGYKF